MFTRTKKKWHKRALKGGNCTFFRKLTYLKKLPELSFTSSFYLRVYGCPQNVGKIYVVTVYYTGLIYIYVISVKNHIINNWH